MRRLVALAYSPWSEKARWALDHHRVGYEAQEYLPIFGEPLLRIRARKLRGKLTVPILLDEGAVVSDSFEIAKHAERIGQGAPLFHVGALDEIRRWNETSERALAAGRALVTNRTARDPVAMHENIPAAIPGAVRPFAGPFVSIGIRYLRRKYSFGTSEVAGHEQTIVDALEALRAALGDRATVLPGGFSYADVVMAVALQFVRPPAQSYIRLGPASRECWTDPGLSLRFADLLEWRDQLYARHR